MKTISVCMIVKNEEDVLKRTLQSIKEIADEIIIVDTGSTDRTKEIAQEFTEKIYDFEWRDDFAAARNASYSYATKDYILFMDADDYLPDEEREKFKRLKQTLDDSVDAVTMYTVMSVDEYGNPVFQFRRHRLVKRSKGFRWYGAVHEYLAVSGNIIHSDIKIHHRPVKKREKKSRNLNIYRRRLQRGETFTPRDVFYYANELKDHGFYQEAIEQYQKFLDSKQGWIEDNIRACIYIADCYQALGDREKEVDALVKSLAYDLPRPEVSCRIGDMYKEKKMYHKAILWYTLAIGLKQDESLAFQFVPYSTWYPHLQCSVCYWYIGNKKLAYEHHLKAKKYRPDDSQTLYNEQFFPKKWSDLLL